jgi:hypothetical protein
MIPRTSGPVYQVPDKQGKVSVYGVSILMHL